jgi:hypothetical protein
LSSQAEAPSPDDEARVVSWKIDLDYDDDEGDLEPVPVRLPPQTPARVPAAA